MNKKHKTELNKLIKEQLIDDFTVITRMLLGHKVEWYNNARRFSIEHAKINDISPYKVAGIIAALSPKNKWERNLLDTINVLKYKDDLSKYNVCTFNTNRDKALQILKLKDNNNLIDNIIKILNGIKTVSFFKNIMGIDDHNTVTVDMWMYRLSNLPRTLPNYQLIQQVILQVAKRLNILGKHVQELLWQYIRDNMTYNKTIMTLEAEKMTLG